MNKVINTLAWHPGILSTHMLSLIHHSLLANIEQKDVQVFDDMTVTTFFALKFIWEHAVEQ